MIVICPYCEQPAALVTGKTVYPHRPDLAHKVFDPVWRHMAATEGLARNAARSKAYQWLAAELGIDPKDCHIGMFDVETCRRVVEVCERVPA